MIHHATWIQAEQGNFMKLVCRAVAAVCHRQKTAAAAAANPLVPAPAANVANASLLVGLRPHVASVDACTHM